MSRLLLGAGCFALVTAALLPTVVYPQLAVLPADPQLEQTLTASGATTLVPDAKAAAGARLLRNVNVTVSNFISEAPTGSAGDNVVWQIATLITVPGEPLINARVEQLSLDRHTARPTNCCGDRIVTSHEDNNGELLTHSGYTAWPFDVQQHSYSIWDINLRHAKTASFVSAGTKDGLRAYQFQAVVPLTGVGTRDLPGGLFGLKQLTVTAKALYADTSTYWIAPQTGDVVAIEDHITQQYTYAGRTLTAFDAALHTPKLPANRFSQDQIGSIVLPWLRSWASFLLVPVGLALLAGAMVLERRRRRTESLAV